MDVSRASHTGRAHDKASPSRYVKVSRRIAGRSGRVMNELLGQTEVVTKNLNPEWNASFKLVRFSSSEGEIA
eukprot:6174535-Pleurochrysis_carterae.AAC.1